MADATLRWNCECSKPPFEGEEILGNDGAIRCPNCHRPLSGDPEPHTRQPQLPSDDGLIKALEGIRVDLIDARRIMRSFGHDSICLKDALDKVEALTALQVTEERKT